MLPFVGKSIPPPTGGRKKFGGPTSAKKLFPPKKRPVAKAVIGGTLSVPAGMDSMSDEQLAAWAIAERQKEVAGDERALQDEMLVDIDGIQGETGPRILGVPENEKLKSAVDVWTQTKADTQSARLQYGQNASWLALNNEEEPIQCSACRDRTHILPCSTQGCAVGLCCTANLSEHGCVDLGSFLDSVRETDPEVRAVLGARTSIDTVHSLATLGETSRGLDKLYKIICQQRLFVCPFCLASKGEAVPYRIRSFNMPRLIPMQLQPILVLYLSQDKLTSSGSTRLYAMLEEIFELQPDRLLFKHLIMKTGGQLTDRDHGDTIAFLRKHTTARILIVVDAQAVIGTGHPVCSGNRTTGLQGAPLRAVLQWYLGRTAYGLLSHHVKEAQVGLVLLTCGPATHEEASLGEIQGLLAQDRVSWIVAWEADSVIPYVVLPPLLSMLNSVFIEYRPIVKAIEMTMTPVLAMTGVVIWLRPEKAVAGREITQQVLVEGSFSRPLGLTPPIQCGTDNCTNTTLQGHYEEANESFKCRWVCTLCGSRTRWTYIKKGSHISRGAFPGTWWHPGPLKRLDVQWTPAPVNQSKAGKQEVDDASAHNRKRTLETLHEDDRPTHKGNSRGKRNHRGGKVKMG